ncbi:Glycerophosphoryl diester phosphodiesterase [Polystyrenella longa]|uniref:Glycerophosphoryl diester phosphodiesterase n=1 Tax=Polystyrenella longa TaxID=2528007 RepID=A0A518CMD1_9PLAN|nr:glycerophosphodiester phosphodiesterase family protein [Polystyrenella longa]QDU80389.1 Glycerophosphoryl diester phosphodiesterase [Polystyrenella longa]
MRSLHSFRANYLKLFSLACISMMSSQGSFADDEPTQIQVVAHRAHHVNFPENTIPAITSAIDIGCDYVELDVRTTADGHLVVLHDSTVDRTTNGHGKLAELTLTEVQSLDAGIKRGEEWKGTRIPTFRECLETCQGKIGVYVDHKNADISQVVRLLNEFDMIEQTIVYCYSAKTVKAYKQHAPQIRVMMGHPDTEEKLKQIMRDVKPETLDGNLSDWTDQQAELARELGAELWFDCLGDSDNKMGWERGLILKATGIQSDRPNELIEFLKTKGLH